MKAKHPLVGVFLTLNLLVWILFLSASTAKAAPPQQGGTIYHTVVRGEILARIAARYSTTVSAIARRNNISNPNRVYVGQRLVIPTAFAASSASVPPSSGSYSAGCTYLIVRGDTLSKIAARHGTTVQFLMSANGLSSSLILAGKTLRVPCVGQQMTSTSVAAPPVSKSVSGTTYRVRSGDTLSSIALLYHTTVQNIMTANSLTNPHHIYVGQVLRIPLR